MIWTGMPLRSRTPSQGRLLIFRPTASDNQEVVLPRGLDITWTCRGKPRAGAAHHICVRQEGRAQRKCCPSIPWRKTHNQYENGTRRQRLFTLSFCFSCYKKIEGTWILGGGPSQMRRGSQLAEVMRLCWPDELPSVGGGGFQHLSSSVSSSGIRWEHFNSIPTGTGELLQTQTLPFHPLTCMFSLVTFCLCHFVSSTLPAILRRFIPTCPSHGRSPEIR